MEFTIEKALEVLERTPLVLDTYLSELSDVWVENNEGENTWSPYDVVGHLIHGEKTDWMERAAIILSDSDDKTFVPFDRFAQMEEGPKKSLQILLGEFRALRAANVKQLKELSLSENDLSKTGIHPELGSATLKELLSAWVVHDLGHIAQISRVMAKQYTSEVGPWIAYLSILK